MAYSDDDNNLMDDSISCDNSITNSVSSVDLDEIDDEHGDGTALGSSTGTDDILQKVLAIVSAYYYVTYLHKTPCRDRRFNGWANCMDILNASIIQDCIGAIYGTYVKAKLPVDQKIPFIGRKGYPTQNIMAICDFDMYFTYVLAGWEEKYYLVDAGYPNIKGFLSPYKGNRMHLSEFNNSRGYRNHMEAFNHRHAGLRVTIEMCFGVWKEKWAIWDDIHVNIPYPAQVALVGAIMALHNFIRFNDKDDEDFNRWLNWVPTEQDSYDRTNKSSECVNLPQNDSSMDKVRDDICMSISFSRIGVPVV